MHQPSTFNSGQTKSHGEAALPRRFTLKLTLKSGMGKVNHVISRLCVRSMAASNRVVICSSLTHAHTAFYRHPRPKHGPPMRPVVILVFEWFLEFPDTTLCAQGPGGAGPASLYACCMSALGSFRRMGAAVRSGRTGPTAAVCRVCEGSVDRAASARVLSINNPVNPNEHGIG